MSDEARLRVASERLELIRAFGQSLERLRRAAGLSRSELAERCRVSQATITKAEAGRSEPRLLLILILCDGLGVTPTQLIGGLPAPTERRRR